MSASSRAVGALLTLLLALAYATSGAGDGPSRSSAPHAPRAPGAGGERVGLGAAERPRVTPEPVAATTAAAAAKLDADAVVLARQLLEAGYPDDAEKKLRGRLDASPGFTVPDGLARAIDDAKRTATTKPSPRVQRIADDVGPVVATIAAFVVLWLVLSLLVELVRRLGAWAASLTTEDDDLPLELRVPSDVAAGTAHALEVALRGHLRALDAGATGHESFRILKPVEQGDFELPKTLDAVVPGSGLLLGVVNAVAAAIPAERRRTLSIELLPADAANGLGLLVAIDGAWSPRIREAHFDLLGEPALSGQHADTRLQALLLPAAIWIAFHARPAAGHFGTTDWKSYAHAAVGANAHARGDLAIAERQYRFALDLSAGNQAARYNLASLLLQPPTVDEPDDAARRRLATVLELLAPLGATKQVADTDALVLKVRARLLEAIAHVYLADLADPPAPEHLTASRRALGQIAAALDLPVGDPDPLAQLRASVVATHAMVTATVELLDGAFDTPLPGLSHAGGTGEDTWLRRHVAYNVACFHARRSAARAKAGKAEEAAADLREALAVLTHALVSRDPVLRRTAATDPSLAPLRAAAGTVAERFAALVTDPPVPKAPPQRHAVTLATADGDPVEVLVQSR
ncbi:MAG: hypothetical protein PGN13_15760 [Patulibacter minatonensis]